MFGIKINWNPALAWQRYEQNLNYANKKHKKENICIVPNH